MKKLYFLFSFFVCSFFFSQVVNIPDANFKALLLSYNANNAGAYNASNNPVAIDTNGNGEIEVSEAAAISKLIMTGNSNIANITGINSFTGLTDLTMYFFSNQAATIEVANLPNLINMTVSNSSPASITVQNCNSMMLFKAQNGLTTAINLQSSSIQTIDIQPGLFSLNSLNISGVTALKNIKVLNSNIASLNLSNIPTLENVEITMNLNLTNINFQGSTGLKNVQVNNNKLASLNLQNCSQLTFLTCYSNLISSLNLNGCSLLNNINAINNSLTTYDFSVLPSIKNADFSNNLLTSIVLNNNTALWYLKLNNNLLQTIPTNQTPNLMSLSINNNQFSNLNFASFPNLGSVFCMNNLFTTLDFSQNNSLYTIYASDNANLQHLIIKNGINSFVNSSTLFSNTPNLNYICADDMEIANVNSYLASINQQNVVVNSYCSFTPGGTFYNIQGNTKDDINTNGCDVNDPMKAFQKFTITNGSVSGNVIANSTGNYTIPVQAGSHTVTPILENPTYFTISPISFTANFPAQASPLTQNFCITSNGNFNDLEVFMIPVTAAVPGFNAKYKLVYKNKGTTTQSGTLTMSFDDNLMNFNTSTVAPNTQNTGNLSWNFTNLLPFETREIILTFTLNTPTATPALNSGNILSYNAIISGATDETPSDNNFTLNQTVVNSFDPNDKTCLEGTAISTAKVGDYVHYLIRFENNGTANAQNIVVKDVIDTNKFDLNSLIALNGSHSFVTRITAPNTVEFIFENIQLPFNDATNDGFVAFKIKTKSTLALGNTFSNSANIYFDYNAPITTNTCTTMVQNVMATSESNITEMALYPNPVRDILTFRTKEKIGKVEVFDLSGRKLGSFGVQGNSINLNQLKTGTYIIKVFAKDKIIVDKIIKN